MRLIFTIGVHELLVLHHCSNLREPSTDQMLQPKSSPTPTWSTKTTFVFQKTYRGPYLNTDNLAVQVWESSHYSSTTKPSELASLQVQFESRAAPTQRSREPSYSAQQFQFDSPTAIAARLTSCCSSKAQASSFRSHQFQTSSPKQPIQSRLSRVGNMVNIPLTSNSTLRMLLRMT